MTHLPCDAPYFIRTQQNYLKAWYYFMTLSNQPYKFFVNPAPRTVADITMNKQKIEYWIDGPVKCTPEIFSLGSNFIFTRDRMNETQFNQNNFFVPYVAANEGFVSSVVAGDIPQFKFMYRLSRTASLKQLQDAFEDVIAVRGRKNPLGDREFDFELKLNKLFLPLKVAYTTEVIKQSLQATKRVVGVVDVNHLDFLAEEWADKVAVNKVTGKAQIRDLREFYETPDLELPDAATFIEKLVHVDFLYDNPITHYFIKFKKFPFELRGDLSARMLRDPESLMIVWYFYYDKLRKRLDDLGDEQQSMSGG